MSIQKIPMDGIFAKQTEARHLIEDKGLPQKEVAVKVGISEKTLGIWIVKFGWVKNNELTNKRRQAEQLVLQQGFTQKEAAKIVGVSEKSLCTWAAKYNWKTKNNSKAPTINKVKFAINNFLLFVDCNAPALSKELRELSEKFYKEEPELLALIK